MVNWKDKSILKSDVISKVWLNRKSYKYLDFEFKYKKDERAYLHFYGFVDVFHFGVKILELKFYETSYKTPKEIETKFEFSIIYFNPKTDNDCNTINHILAVCSEYSTNPNKDLGSCDLLNNQYVYRKKRNYYSYTLIWGIGEIEKDNYNKSLSYEFATDEYVNYIKYIFKIQKIQRRTIKKTLKGYLDKVLILEKLRLKK